MTFLEKTSNFIFKLKLKNMMYNFKAKNVKDNKYSIYTKISRTSIGLEMYFMFSVTGNLGILGASKVNKCIIQSVKAKGFLYE